MFARKKGFFGSPGASLSHPQERKEGAKEKNKFSKVEEVFGLSWRLPHTPKDKNKGARENQKVCGGERAAQPRREKKKGFGGETRTKCETRKGTREKT